MKIASEGSEDIIALLNLIRDAKEGLRQHVADVHASEVPYA